MTKCTANNVGTETHHHEIRWYHQPVFEEVPLPRYMTGQEPENKEQRTENYEYDGTGDHFASLISIDAAIEAGIVCHAGHV